MKCPFCGNEMKEGTLHSGGRYVQWKGVDASAPAGNLQQR